MLSADLGAAGATGAAAPALTSVYSGDRTNPTGGGAADINPFSECAGVVDATLHDIVPKLEKDDIVIDGGNSYYIDDIRRAQELSAKGIHYCDVGTSGGVWGLERGYCMMIGGDTDAVTHLDPIFKTLAPGREAAPLTPGRTAGTSTAGTSIRTALPIGKRTTGLP